MIKTKIILNGQTVSEKYGDDLKWLPKPYEKTVKDKDFKKLECITKLGNSILKIQITKF